MKKKIREHQQKLQEILRYNHSQRILELPGILKQLLDINTIYWKF